MKRPLVLGILGVLVVAGAIALNWTLRPPDLSNAGRTTAGATRPETGAPSFDVERIDALGNTVMAGRAAPGASVVILDGETEIGRVVADTNGEWVFTPDKPLAPGTHELSLAVTDTAGRTLASEKVVVMSVPERGGEVLIVEQSRAGGKSRVLQGPDAPPEMKALTVDALDYDDQGRIAIGGKADPGSRVQVYLDNTPIGVAETDSRGVWQLSPETRATPGSHTVRADEIGANENVLARVEVPFTVTMPETATGASVTVVRGNSLWRIARRIYGQGTQYSIIFDANREQIRDPNLIYPGQVFQTPPPKSGG